MKPFLLAVQFLTRVPVPVRLEPTPAQFGQSMLWYPLVGLMLGAALAGLAALLATAMPPLPAAAVLLTLWILLTGALHLDGLADSADAWLGGYSDRERTLAIMQDPHCGAAGVVALVSLLLLKFSALAALIENQRLEGLLFAPLIARMAIPALFLSTPYVRPGGLGEALAQHLPRRTAMLVLGLSLGAVCALGRGPAFIAILAALALSVALRQMMLNRLGGTTGDTAGALIEIVEAGVLLSFVV